jgi:hypothetical protein
MDKASRNSSETSSVASSEDTAESRSRSDSGPDFAEFAYNLSLKPRMFSHYNVSNGSFADISVPSDVITKKEELPKKTDLTTIFIIDSINRDKASFPQPTSFSLKLPRVYQNVKSIQLTEVKFLCSFYYFSAAKNNIYLPIIERGRGSITNSNNVPITKLITIRQGTYSINDLLNEIQTQLNYTPLFYDFANGFIDFINLFSSSGDYSINFNQPGDTYYDSLNSKYITNPTMDLIISYYWGTRYAGLSSYSLNQLKVAYYYPVLYELLLDLKDTIARPFLNLTPPLFYSPLDGIPVETHVIFNMSGIDDPIALHLINNNLTHLDKYRLNHTFRYNLVNRYQVSYDTNSLNVNFTTLTLNTSLVNLFNTTTAASLASIYNNSGLTPATYATLQSVISKTTVIYTDMFNYLQLQLATLVGISYATYTPAFFNNLSNILYFQNGIDAVGITSNYTPSYLTSGGITISSSIVNYSDSPVYWPNLVSTNGYTGTNLKNLSSSLINIPYNIITGNFQFGTAAIDPNTYYFNTNKITNSIDIVVKILPAKYTIIKFKSSARQSLQVETLPLPYYYRYSDFNKLGLYKGVLDLSKNNVPQKYFDLSYSYVYNISNNAMDILNYSPNILTANFGDSLSTSFGSANIFTINTVNNYYYFEFTTPYPLGLESVPIINSITLSLISLDTLNISTIFTDTFTMFLYHDRGAFMADLGRPRAENPLHYIASKSISPNSESDITLNLSTIAGDKYYIIFRSNALACSNNIFKPLLYYKSNEYTILNTSYTNFNPLANPFDQSNLSTYAIVSNYNPDFLRLPTASSLTSIDPTNSTFNTTLNSKGIPIGYDISGVSNDLTDYIGFNTVLGSIDLTATFRIDPLNNYLFQVASPFNIIAGTYFGSTSSNVILNPITNNPHIFQGTSTSQLKIVQWYEGYSIPQQLDDQFYSMDDTGILQTSSLTTALPGFPRNTNNNIVFGKGVTAIGFLPRDGVYEVDTFSFKSVIYPLNGSVSSSNDPNLQIKYIGVFSGSALENPVVTLSSALTVLRFSTSIPYGPKVNTTNMFPYGTWYSYVNDTAFVSVNPRISGNTPNSTDLLSYNSMYYMVPFNADGELMTYSILSGNILPYPLAQTAIFSTIYLSSQIATNTTRSSPQPGYIIPVSNNNSSLTKYGPPAIFSQSQSQYEQSMTITTPSIGYRQNTLLLAESGSLFSFSTIFNTPIGLTTFFTEFSDTLFLVNATSNICSNANTSFPTAAYASSLSTVISVNNGNSSCINFMINQATALQNYTVTGKNIINKVFTFSEMAGDNRNITTRSIEIKPSMSNITLWMWGGGGGSLSSLSTTTGGAGAYVKVNINPQTLLQTTTSDSPGGISTLYIVVGKGGNRNNFILEPVVGSLQLYEQIRYGGGGTTLTGKFMSDDSITAQGGGFSGIFSGSNIATATPLLIVGGGGAAGTNDFGGPGGFGLVSQTFSTSTYRFSTITFNGNFYDKLSIQSISDVLNNSFLSGSNVTYAADNNLTTFWNPVIPSKMNPFNYYPTPNTYGVSLNFSMAISALSKIRFYGPPTGNTSNLVTGITIYNDINKRQILFSNTSILSTDYLTINNGSFLQQIYECIPIAQVSTATLAINAWLAVGTNASSQSSIQYSLDLINWVPTQNNVVTSVTSVQYVPAFSKWFASGSTIASSSNGINWSVCIVNGFTGSTFTSMAFSGSTLVAGANDGSIYTSTDGITWNSSGIIFRTSVKRIRYVNEQFWGMAGVYLKKSVNGIIWSSILNFTVSNINDIAYAFGKYVIAQVNGQPPLVSGLVYSSDGIAWTSSALTNVQNFSATSIAYGNSTLVAAGYTTDGTSFIKYSSDGINWVSSSFSSIGDTLRNDIQFSITNGKFLSVGQAKSGTGLAANQDSILSSSDGISWSYSLTGGFNSDAGAYQGFSAAYGPVSIIPNLSTLYIEFQKITFINIEPRIYDIRVYNTETPITTSTAPLLDTSLSSIFYPSELTTVDVIQYPFIMQFSTVIPLLNYIQIYTPAIAGAQFTTITISLDSTLSSIIFSNTVSSSTVYDGSTPYNLYSILLIPQLINISTLYFTFTKITSGSLQIAGINGLYDPNMIVEQYLSSAVQDIDSRLPNDSTTTVSTVIDGNLNTFWYPKTFIQGGSLKMTFSFSTFIDRINHIQIVNGVFPSIANNLITGIGVFTDSTKSSTIYYSTDIQITRYSVYSIININIPSLLECNSIYIELYKTTPGIPLINEIRFYNIGLLTTSPNGYSGGQPILMTRTSTAYSGIHGGGGVTNTGGSAGIQADSGNYLSGGSPAVLAANKLASASLELRVTAGGGGGGYYGGGGGGYVENGTGGAGGGGSGYIYDQSIFNLLDYAVANPSQNYITPELTEQKALTLAKVLAPESVAYGQGGVSSIDNGAAGHGILIITYEESATTIPPSTSTVQPVFIDGSKIILFNASLKYSTESRSLAFTQYSDSLQLSSRAGYNWVWYNSYLSLVGNTLLSSLQPSTLIQSSVPPRAFLHLPPPIFAQLNQSQLFTAITEYFSAAIRDPVDVAAAITSITSMINSIFILFQNNFFIRTLYTDPSYVEMTELYCLLDYLRNPVNLANPHVNPSNPTLDRILGGIPRFGYWANPFLTNVSYVGFDVAASQLPTPALSTIVGGNSKGAVQAFYGLVLEQSLSTGAYEFKDIMAYKPTLKDSQAYGSGWLTATQFTDAYAVRSLTNPVSLESSVIVQPYTFKNAISARLSLFSYKVYSIPYKLQSIRYDIPVQVLNDFEGQSIALYSFQNNITSDISSINVSYVPFRSTMLYMNQTNISRNLSTLGTLVSEHQSTTVNIITSFKFDSLSFTPLLMYSQGTNNYYNTFVSSSQLASGSVGKALIDHDQNYYIAGNNGSNVLYQNVSSLIIDPVAFPLSTINYASPKFILTQYNSGNQTPYSDFFESKFTNIWHFPANNALSAFYGARLTSPYDLSVVTSFANQVFYPTHKIGLIKKSSAANPITNPLDTQTYPSYQRTQMFLYKSFSSLVTDISGQFAMEKAVNFSYADSFSGYGFKSYLNKVILQPSDTTSNPDSFYYLAIRGYSPTETFQSVVRFFLPQRYDYGFITLLDLSNEPQRIKNLTNVNPDYRATLTLFNSLFSTSRIYGSVGIPGFSGSNITTTSFGDFLRQFNMINSINTSNNAVVSTVTGYSNAALSTLINGDLQYILPSYLASRNRVIDPIEFSIPFSSCIAQANIGLEQYGLGYNLGYSLHDTTFNTVQRATSFFKILDDYIYLQLNEEFNMNRMDISQPENYSRTRDTTAKSGIYNSKLILNNFGSFATTFVHSPVNFNPTVGKIDKLSFTWYSSAGILLNNADCEWTGSVQIVEAVNTPQ